MDRGTAAALLLGALVLGCGGDGEAAQRTTEAGDAPVIAADPAETPSPAGAGEEQAARDAEGDVPDVAPSTAGAPAADEAGEARDPSPASPGPAATGDAAPAPAPDAEPGAAPAAGQEPGTAEILRETARAYEGLRSFRAEFDQELRNTLLGRTTRSSGTLYQRQPDRFLMDFSDPEGDLIVSDGDWFWMYFPSVDAKQVLRSPRGGQGLDLRAQFVGDPVRRFEATYHGSEEVRGRASYVLTLVPREPAGYERMKVWIDADDHLVRRFELAETSGNVRRMELRDFRANPSLPDDLFEFTPPAGAQVVTRG